MKKIYTTLLAVIFAGCVGLSVYATSYAVLKEFNVVQPIDPSAARRERPF